MNLFFFRLSFLILALFVLGGEGLAKSIVPPQGYIPPKEADIIRIESISIDPLNVDFLAPDGPNEITGRVVGFSQKLDLENINFVIHDVNGGVLWRYKFNERSPDIRWDTRRDKALMFSFDLTGVFLSKGAYLEVLGVSRTGATVASGEERLPLGDLQAVLSLKDVRVKFKNEVSAFASFGIDNPFKEEQVLGVVMALERENGKLVSSVERNAVKARPDRQTSMVIPFEPPEDPGVYVVRLNLLDEAGEPMGAEFTEKFVIDGDFARINVFEFIPLMEGEEEIQFVYKVTAKDGDRINANLSVQHFAQGVSVEETTHRQKVELTKNVFEGLMKIGVRPEVDVLEATLTITRKGGDVLAVKKETIAIERVAAQVAANKTGREKQREASKWKAPGWILWGALPFLILLVALANWAGVWGRKFIWFITLSTVGMSSVQASTIAPQAWWLHPVSSWYFNTTPDTGFEDFSKTRFQASMLSGLSLTSSTLFTPNSLVPNDADGRPASLILRFTNGSVTGDLALDVSLPSCLDSPPPNPFDWRDCTDIDGLVITENAEFIFDADFASGTMAFVSAGSPNVPDFLVDGSWDFEVLFCMGDSPGVNCTTGQYYGTTAKIIQIDKTEPDLSIEYDGDPTKRLIKPLISTDDVTLGTQLNAYGLALADRHAKVQQQKNEQALLSQKTNQYDHRGFLIGDLNDQIAILDYQTSQINEQLADSLLGDPSPERTALNVEKAALEGERSGAQSQITLLQGQQSALNTQIAGHTSTIATLTTDITARESEITTLQSNAVGSIPALQLSINTEKRKSGRDFVAVDVACDEASGSRCRTGSYPIRVKGNFCDDTDDGSNLDPLEKICDHAGVNGVSVCDQVGNCTDSSLEAHQIEIDWYDPIVPEILSVTVPTNGKASAGIQIPVTPQDLRRNDAVVVADHAGGQFNSHACGYTTDSPLYNAGSECRDRFQICSISPTKRGIKNVASGAGAACATRCDDGFIYDDQTNDGIDNGLCLPECDQRNLNMCLPAILDRGDCIDDPLSWAPDPSTIGSGVEFSQTNNCGKRRQSVGTSGASCSNPNTFGCAQYDAGIYQN